MSDLVRNGLDERGVEEAVVASLRRRKGKATLGDVVVDTGLPKADVEQVLRSMLSRYRSHLAVDENGELLYIFDPAMRPRDGDGRVRELLRRAATYAWWGFTLLCKVGLMVVLVGYFVVFLALSVGLVFGIFQSGRNERRRSSGGGTIVYLLFRVLIEFFIVTSTRREEYLARGEAPRPFYEKVFAFVFGPEAAKHWGVPKPKDDRSFEKGLLAAIRGMLGVVPTTEVVRYTGWSYARADEETTRLLVDYEGDPVVTDDGIILYRFPGLMVSAGAASGPEAVLDPWYSNLEPKALLTGNSTMANLFIGFMNLFVLGLSVVLTVNVMQGELYVSPWLTWVPMVFSATMLFIPAVRAFFVAAENRRRRARNIRRAILYYLFDDADRGREPRLRPDRPPHEAIEIAGGDRRLATQQVEQVLHDLEGEPDATESGDVVYRFPRLKVELDAAREQREQVDRAEHRLGEIVYSSAD